MPSSCLFEGNFNEMTYFMREIFKMHGFNCSSIIFCICWYNHSLSASFLALKLNNNLLFKAGSCQLSNYQLTTDWLVTGQHKVNLKYSHYEVFQIWIFNSFKKKCSTIKTMALLRLVQQKKKSRNVNWNNNFQ